MKQFLIVRAEKNQQPEILIHGQIVAEGLGIAGITAKEFCDELNKFPVGTKVTIGVNCIGGQVGEGLAIYNAIKRRAADITFRNDGYALSIASVFAQAAGRVISPKSSIWMIHRASNVTGGNADDKRKDAEMLDTHDKVILAAYCERTGKSEAEVLAALKAETWFTGSEAVAWGLADVESDDEAATDRIDPSNFKNVPQNIRNILTGVKPVAPINSNPLKQIMNEKEIESLYDQDPDALELKWQQAAKAEQWENCFNYSNALAVTSPDRTSAMLMRSVALRHLGRNQDAYDYLQPALNSDPENHMVHFNLACYANLLGKKDEACDHLQNAFNLGDSAEVERMAAGNADLADIEWRADGGE